MKNILKKHNKEVEIKLLELVFRINKDDEKGESGTNPYISLKKAEQIEDFFKSQNQQLYNKIIEGVEKVAKGIKVCPGDEKTCDCTSDAEKFIATGRWGFKKDFLNQIKE